MQASGALAGAEDGGDRSQRCQVWGVLNVTPDSFSDGGWYFEPASAFAHARSMLEQGADVIDIGGASSRPRGKLYGEGAAPVSEDEELERVVPVIEMMVRELGARVSVDTVRAVVAREALRAGARIVNDVSGGASESLLDVVATHGAECVLMHNRGQGEVSAVNTAYRDVVTEVTDALLDAVERACARGMQRDKLWIDPGLGFAKTSQQTLTLLAHTATLAATGLRVLCGPSRKGFIAEVAPGLSGARLEPSARVPGTLAAVTVAVLGGARAVRVHDVAATRQALLVAEAIRRLGRGC